jgi:hypothetical protein
MGKHTTNEKDPRVTSTGPFENHTTNALDSTGTNPAQLELNLDRPKRKYSRKSTATEAQYERIDRAFDYLGKLISTLDFRKMGVLHPAGRIKEMIEKLGYDIRRTDLRTVIDEHGFPHLRIAFYELFARPTKAA